VGSFRSDAHLLDFVDVLLHLAARIPGIFADDPQDRAQRLDAGRKHNGLPGIRDHLVDPKRYPGYGREGLQLARQPGKSLACALGGFYRRAHCLLGIVAELLEHDGTVVFDRDANSDGVFVGHNVTAI